MNKNKHRFNIVDVFLILALIAIVGVMYYFTVARNSVTSNSVVTVDYTIELKTVRADHIDKISVGDKVVETVRDQQIGEVHSVAIVPSYNMVTNGETGEMFISTYPAINEKLSEEDATVSDEELLYDYYNVKVTIRDKVKKSEKGYNVNGFDIIVGEMVYFRVPSYVGSGYCVRVNEVNE